MLDEQPTFLIVDKTEAGQKLSQAITEQQGAKSVVCESAEEALKLCGQRMPKAILIEYYTPSMSFKTFMELFKGLLGHNLVTVFVWCSRYRFEDSEAAKAAGADLYLCRNTQGIEEIPGRFLAYGY